MAKVLNLVDVQGSNNMPSKRPASSTADVPVSERPAISHIMPIHEGRSPHVSVCNSLYLLILLLIHLYRLA